MTLKRTLTTRQISMIAIGGSIGTGIFLASGNVIHSAGPGGALIAYAIMGLMVYFLMTSLSEMSSFLPSTGSFYVYAARFVDPALGFALGYNYWFNWAITVAAEISAATLVMQYWFPHSPGWLWSIIFWFFFVITNAITVKGFGEIEYWLSLIKVTTVVVFIIIGTALIFGWGSHTSPGFTNWVTGDAPFHNGWVAIFNAFVIAGFSFQGTELIGVAAGESKTPEKTIPSAIKWVFWRIILFYICTILVTSFLIPYSSKLLASDTVTTSPFTLVFTNAGITSVAWIMNAVILIAILSAGNSGMYASSRMLWYLSKKNHVPKLFTRVNSRGVPVFALAATALIAMVAFLSSVAGSGQIYLWLLNASSLTGFIAWLGIAVSHYRFRKAYVAQGRDIKDLPYVAKGYPYAPLLAFALCIIVIGGQDYLAFSGPKVDWYGLLVAYISVPLFLVLWLGYKFTKKTKVIPLMECDFNSDYR